MSNKGFTIPELIVTLTVLGILIGLLFTPFNDLYESNRLSLQSATLVSDTKNALVSIEKEVALAVSFSNTNSNTDALGPDDNAATSGQWSWTGVLAPTANSRVLITENYATTELAVQDDDASRTLVPDSSDCTTPLTNTMIYFVKNSTLYRRTIKNPTAPCAGYTIAQKTSCAVGVTHSSCEATDAKLLTNVTNFTVAYYQSPGSTGPLGGQYSTNSVPSQSQSIVISLTTARETNTSSETIRITRLNGDSS